MLGLSPGPDFAVAGPKCKGLKDVRDRGAGDCHPPILWVGVCGWGVGGWVGVGVLPQTLPSCLAAGVEGGGWGCSVPPHPTS